MHTDVKTDLLRDRAVRSQDEAPAILKRGGPLCRSKANAQEDKLFKVLTIYLYTTQKAIQAVPTHVGWLVDAMHHHLSLPLLLLLEVP